MIAWLAGASGLVGGQLLNLLLNDASVTRVVTLGRSEFKRQHAKWQQQVVDFGAIAPGLAAPTVAFCCLGSTIKVAGSKQAFARVDHDFVLSFAQAAKAAGAATFVLVSSIGASAKAGSFYLRVKGQTESDVQALGFASVYVARPSMLLGHRREFRLGERLAIPLFYGLWPLLIGPLKKYRAIQAQVVAQAMLRAASQPKTGFHILESDALQRLGRAP
ncbi:MAG: oxidoreductase [Planctomycetes bacterium]|nr:oxidoreductase [Planctomycetota bacterium]